MTHIPDNQAEKLGTDHERPGNQADHCRPAPADTSPVFLMLLDGAQALVHVGEMIPEVDLDRVQTGCDAREVLADGLDPGVLLAVEECFIRRQLNPNILTSHVAVALNVQELVFTQPVASQSAIA